LSDDEIKLFWSATGKIDEPARQCLRLLLLTGARLNEIARLVRSEVDGGIITLSGERTKNRLPHLIPLPKLAQEILSSVRTKGELIFVARSGRPVGPWSRIKRQLDALMNIPPWRFHDLRRTASSNHAKLGIRPEVTEAVLNHVSGAKSGVAGTYNRWHYLPEKTAALARWSDHVLGLVEGRVATVVDMKKRRRP
jgi:integrase